MAESMTASAPRENVATHPSRRAAILQTHLAPDALAALTSALNTGGFEPDVLASADLMELRWDDLPLREVLRRYDALVIDDVVGGRSGLEYVQFCLAYPDTAGIPVTLLHAQEETDLLTAACYSAGVTHLLRKDDPAAVAAAFRPSMEVKHGDWSAFSEEAQRIVIQAQREAISNHENCVSTEHLLLGALHDRSLPVAHLLSEDMGVSLEQIEAKLKDASFAVAPGVDGLPLMLTPRSKNVLDLARQEAAVVGRRFVSEEDLLLGLVRESEGVAARVLLEVGVTLERLRDAIGTRRVE